MDDLMKQPEVSAVTGAAIGTLKYWRHIGVGPKSFKVGKHVFYKREDVDQWMREQYAATVVGDGVTAGEAV